MPIQHTRDWVDFLEALGPLIAVVAVLAVGVMQVYLQRQQLKQDLFDKRYHVFEVFYAFGIAYLSGEDPP